VNRWLITTALLFGLVGCGTNSDTPPPVVHKLLITWDDGDTGRPVCGNPVDCKSGYTVHDKTTGKTADVPIGTLEYMAPTDLDTYEVRTNGYDNQGQPISSPYKPVPPAQ
jgi:hypothetical protein